MLRRREIRYRRPLLVGFMRPMLGRKVQDDQTGFWTYSGYTVKDDFGTVVDRRGQGFDQDFERKRREG